jgi:hypothetical protein
MLYFGRFRHAADSQNSAEFEIGGQRESLTLDSYTYIGASKAAGNGIDQGPSEPNDKHVE